MWHVLALSLRMTEPQAEMHEAYARANSQWPEEVPVITEADLRNGKIDEVIRWCRDRLGGRDEDLVGPLRWAEACNNGWSPRATYSCLPSCSPGKTWRRYVRDISYFVYSMLPTSDGGRNYDSRSLLHARLELELTELVVGWFTDEAHGIRRRFPPLLLSQPPDLRGI